MTPFPADRFDAEALDIGEVVRRTGVPTTTLHVWEREGVLIPVGRAGLRRQYSPDTIERVAVIVVCQRSGFTLKEIADLLRPGAFDEGKGRLADKLSQLRDNRRHLDQAIDGIEHAISCTHASPLQCPNFKTKLGTVLPVNRNSGPPPQNPE